MAAKLSKPSVNYRPRVPLIGRSCGQDPRPCSMWRQSAGSPRGVGYCTLVSSGGRPHEGVIKASGVCNRWVAA